MKPIYFILILLFFVGTQPLAVAGINPQPVKPMDQPETTLVQAPYNTYVLAQSPEMMVIDEKDIATIPAPTEIVKEYQGSHPFSSQIGILCLIICLAAFFGFPYLLEAFNQH